MNQEKYRPDIDGLRAIAIISVVGYHVGIPGFSGGFVGVDIFFVISGFLITSLLISEIEKNNTISFLGFYSRRVRRLFPAMLPVIVTVLLIWFLFFLGVAHETSQLMILTRYTLFGFANIFLKNNVGGYFDRPLEEIPLLHFWSLGVEEQFYFMWPMVIYIIGKIAHSKNIKLTHLIFSVLIFTIFGSFAYSHFLLTKNLTNEAFYSLLPRMWELCLGALLVFINGPFSKLESQKKQFLGIIAPSLASILILISITTYSSKIQFPGLFALAPTIGASLFIVCGYIPNFFSRVLSSRPLVRIGLLSYSWYLWHWPLLAFATLWGSGQSPQLQYRLVLAVVALILAELSFRIIEHPIRQGFLSKVKSTYIVLIFMLLSSLVVIATSAISHYETRYVLPMWETFTKLIRERTSLPAKCGQIENNFTSCEIKPKGQLKSSIVVWGDSHAYAIFSLFEELAWKRSFETELFSAIAVPSMLSSEENIRNGVNKNIIEYHNRIFNELQNKIKTYKHVSVVLASRWVHYASGMPAISLHDSTGFLDTDKTKEGTLRVFQESFVKTLTALNQIGISRIMVILPYPEFKFDVLRCKQRTPHQCQTLRKDMEEYCKDVRSIIVTSIKDFNNVQALDPVEVLCDSKICPQIIVDHNKEIPVVFDDDHPTASAMRLIFQKKKAVFNWLTDHN